MNCTVTPLKSGIVRISKHAQMPEKYLERYGIVRIPRQESVHDVIIEENAIVLPSGKRLEFTIRPEADELFWEQEMDYQLKRFKEQIPSKINIEGRPEVTLKKWDESLDGRDSKKKFGISFQIGSDEKFYGLGEAERKKIQHRGGSYQNWSVYQFNEISIPLVYSNENWGVFIYAENRHFVDIDDLSENRMTILGNFDELDVFVLYGDSMKDIIRLYTEISGRSMLLPKWTYGLTYIAQIHQNQFEILNDMMKFREKHIPCDNVSLEPGWMSKFYDYSFEKDWDLTKFHVETWMRNRNYPSQFVTVMKRFGFHVALWLCLNYDLCDQEERLVTGEGKLPSWYDHLKKFVDTGVDGFKMDPADMLMRVDTDRIYTNGKSEMEMHNISQVLVVKQIYKGFAEQMNKRPHLHYCGGYTGQQRWGAATTGDNGGREGSLIWLLNLAMSGFMNTTVDMDIYSAESIHFAMLAPWAHHNAWSGCRQPWYAGAENERIYTYYAQLRYSLLPYIYSAAIEGHETGVPMLRPMPLEFQDDKKCLELSNQYMFGEYIMLSAYTNHIYLPEGEWIDYWTGQEYAGPYEITDYLPPEERGGGFFIKKGAIIPKWRARDFITQYGEEEIELHFYPKGKSEYVFREDDGESLDYETNISCHTLITCELVEDVVSIHIGKRCGEYQNKPVKRKWIVHVHGTTAKVKVVCEEELADVVIG